MSVALPYGMACALNAESAGHEQHLASVSLVDVNRVAAEQSSTYFDKLHVAKNKFSPRKK